MEQSLRLQRKRTNVDFLDETGDTFAGLYVLQGSSITIVEALDMLKTSFTLTFSKTSERSNGEEHVWAIYPIRGQLSHEAFSLDKPLVKGRYYIVRHTESWEGIGTWKDHVLGEYFCSVIVQAAAGGVEIEAA